MLSSFIRPVLILALCLLAGCVGSQSGPPAIGEAYVGPQTLTIRRDLAPNATAAATAKHGDKLEVLQVRRRFVRVRTSSGAMGWTDSRQLLSTAQMDELKTLAREAASLPSQGSATVYEPLNVHTEPSRVSPSFAQIAENTPVDVVGHRLAPKVAPTAGPVVPPPPKPTPKKRVKPREPKGVPPPPMPAAPALPPNWLELSRAAKPEPGKEEQFAREFEPPREKEKEEPPAEKPIPMEDWSLVRLKDGRSGWVLFRMLVLGIPEEVAQYAEGHRITSYFPLYDLADQQGQPKHYWLWTTINKGGQPFEYDGLRVFVYNTKRNRYETAYRERDVKGFYPTSATKGTGVRGEGATFTTILQKNGAFVRRTYSFNGRRVSLEKQEPCPPPHGAEGEAPDTDAAQPASPQVQPPGILDKLKERARSVLKR